MLAVTSEGLLLLHEKSESNKIFDYERVSIIPPSKHSIDFSKVFIDTMLLLHSDTYLLSTTAGQSG